MNSGCNWGFIITTWGSHIGKFLGNCNIYNNIIRAIVLPNYHSCVNFFTWINEKSSSILKFIYRIFNCCSCFLSNKGAHSSSSNLSFPRFKSNKAVCNYCFPFRNCKYIVSQSNNTSWRYREINLRTVAFWFNWNNFTLS